MADKKEQKLRTITLDEVKDHKSASSCWIIIHNKIYDVTKFLDEVGFRTTGIRSCYLTPVHACDVTRKTRKAIPPALFNI